MKKLVLFAAVALTVAFTACNKEAKTEEPAAEEPKTEVTTEEAQPQVTEEAQPEATEEAQPEVVTE